MTISRSLAQLNPLEAILANIPLTPAHTPNCMEGAAALSLQSG